jgi:hypothetical protein
MKKAIFSILTSGEYKVRNNLPPLFEMKGCDFTKNADFSLKRIPRRLAIRLIFRIIKPVKHTRQAHVSIHFPIPCIYPERGRALSG